MFMQARKTTAILIRAMFCVALASAVAQVRTTNRDDHDFSRRARIGAATVSNHARQFPQVDLQGSRRSSGHSNLPRTAGQ
jgi:hypothetical protein